MITVQDSRKVVFAHFWNDPNRSSKFEQVPFMIQNQFPFYLYSKYRKFILSISSPEILISYPYN